MVELKQLLALNDFKNLDDTSMVDIAEHAKLVEYQENDRLVAEQMSVFTLYLLAGELDIQTTGGIHQAMSSKTDRAQEPVFFSDMPLEHKISFVERTMRSIAKLKRLAQVVISYYGIIK